MISGNRSIARTNPFRSERIEALRFRFPSDTAPWPGWSGEAPDRPVVGPDENPWRALMLKLRALGGRGAIIGPNGSGKTTLLLELARRLRQAGSAVDVVLADGRSRLGTAAAAALVEQARRSPGFLLLDGADRLTGRVWRRLLAARPPKAGLVVTRHRPGRLPLLYECRTNRTLLAELISDLLAQAADATSIAPGWPPADADLAGLFAACGGNLRSVFGRLFDRWPGAAWERRPATGVGISPPPG